MPRSGTVPSMRFPARSMLFAAWAIVATHAAFAATKELNQLVGSIEKQDIILKGGHVSLLAGPNASTRMWPVLDRWLSERST